MPASSPEPRPFASPAARSEAARLGRDLTRIKGSGPGGRIILADLKTPVSERAIPPSTAPDALRTGQINLRREIRIEPLWALRETINSQLPKGDRLSVNVFLLKACAIAGNQSGLGPVGLAMTDDRPKACPGAHEMRLCELARQIGDQGEEAEADFSLINLGPSSVQSFDMPLTPPERAVLCVGAASLRPVPAPQGGVTFERSLSVTLCLDPACMDAFAGAQLLDVIAQQLEHPAMMLV